MHNLDKLLSIFPLHIQALIRNCHMEYSALQEIRIRIHAPICIRYRNEKYTLSQGHGLHQDFSRGYVITQNDIRELIEYMSRYSLYAYEEELKQGFMTIEGGHRIGIAGQAVTEHEHVKTIRSITFINIRVAHEVKGCADKITEFVRHSTGIYHTLIISPPSRGKTTLLRDIVRQLSNGTGTYPCLNVGVVDERSEIAACHLGIPQNDIGIHTDVLDNCSKAQGMLMLIRSMSPEVIAVDEIGGEADIQALEYAIHCGCSIISTIHGNGPDDIRQKPAMARLLEQNVFERFITLAKNGRMGRIESVTDMYGKSLA